MELAFREEIQSYLREKRYDLLFQEQTAEMSLPETMPDIDRILDSFGMGSTSTSGLPVALSYPFSSTPSPFHSSSIPTSLKAKVVNSRTV